MQTAFVALMNGLARRDGRYAGVIPEDWMQGRTTFGGLAAAYCLQGALRAFPQQAPLRSAQVAFVGPAGGPVEIETAVLRAGRAVTFLGADLFAGKSIATRALFAFGESRSSAFDRIFTQAPSVPAPEDCDPFFDAAFEPAFARHFENRLAKGGRPVSGSPEHDHYVWVRHRDEQATSIAALLALADMPPPAMMPMFTEFAPISSITWMVNFLTSAPRTRDGWWLLQFRAENASGGYSSQDMMVWNRDGAPVIAGRQSVAIFA
jgi:acyl-CoA thioesterase